MRWRDRETQESFLGPRGSEKGVSGQAIKESRTSREEDPESRVSGYGWRQEYQQNRMHGIKVVLGVGNPTSPLHHHSDRL
jgi:hypothetical protein